MKTQFFLLIAVVLVALVSCGSDKPASRRVDVDLNPGCIATKCKDSDNLLHIRATGDSDIVHYIYSTIGAFSILLFRTSLNAKLTVDWDNLLSKDAAKVSGSVKFSEEPQYKAAYVFPAFYEFNDVNGTADITQAPDNDTIIFKTNDLLWKQFHFDTNLTNSIGTFESKTADADGSVRFVVRCPGTDTRDKTLPHLLLTPEACSVDFIIDSVVPSYTQSKMMLRVFALTEKSQNATQNKVRTLDDEYTPGTFNEWNVQITDTTNANLTGYFIWKPIFYFYDPKTLENSTITRQLDTLQYTQQNVPLSVASAFYETSKIATPGSLDVTFGLAGLGTDGYFYTQSNFSEWSFSVGVGEVPKERMSALVTMVILVGFGLPAVIIVLGLVVMTVRKLRSNGAYSQFNEL